MSYLLFLDESGHDHRNLPYEVHGGFALQAKKLWPFVKALTTLEQAAFGDRLHRFQKEIKGSKLLDTAKGSPSEPKASFMCRTHTPHVGKSAFITT